MLFPNNDDLAHWAGVLWNNLDLTSPFFADLATLAKKKSHISLSVLTSAYAVPVCQGKACIWARKKVTWNVAACALVGCDIFRTRCIIRSNPWLGIKPRGSVKPCPLSSLSAKPKTHI